MPCGMPLLRKLELIVLCPEPVHVHQCIFKSVSGKGVRDALLSVSTDLVIHMTPLPKPLEPLCGLSLWEIYGQLHVC